MNRAIKAHDLDAIYVCGPGHGGPGMVANIKKDGVRNPEKKTQGDKRVGRRHRV